MKHISFHLAEILVKIKANQIEENKPLSAEMQKNFDDLHKALNGLYVEKVSK